MVKKLQRRLMKDLNKTTRDLFKKMNKVVGSKNDFVKGAQFKNWIFVSVLLVLLTIIVSSRNMNVIFLTLVASSIHYSVTHNITSAVMSGSIVGVLLLLFIRYKVEEMRENLSERDDAVVTDAKGGEEKKVKLPIIRRGDKTYVQIEGELADTLEQKKKLAKFLSDESKELAKRQVEANTMKKLNDTLKKGSDVTRTALSQARSVNNVTTNLNRSAKTLSSTANFAANNARQSAQLARKSLNSASSIVNKLRSEQAEKLAKQAAAIAKKRAFAAMLRAKRANKKNIAQKTLAGTGAAARATGKFTGDAAKATGKLTVDAAKATGKFTKSAAKAVFRAPRVRAPRIRFRRGF